MMRIALLVAVYSLSGCSGGDGAGASSTTAPTITSQPASATVEIGESATFSVEATGSPPLRYQWRRNGVTVTGATSGTYSTGPTSAGDSGVSFTVVVSNSAGAVTSGAATLTVNAPAVAPSITTQPASQNVTAGQTASFSVLASGTAPLSYQWKRAGVAIAGAVASSYTTPVTTIADDGAVFSVTVSNSSGSVTSANATLTVGAPVSTGPFGHIVIVLEENQDAATVIGDPSMPYLNSLINKYGLATRYYANGHPSISDYMMLTTGQILTSDDSETPATFPVSVDNVVRELLAAGKTWKAYGEDLPYVGYTGGDSGNFAIRHFPLAYMTDVQDSATQVLNLVPFTQFATDLASGQLPNYSFVTPNLCDDAHSCSVAIADSWLQSNIAPLLSSTPFKDDGLLIITFDESADDDTNGGGRIATVLVSPAFSKTGYKSTTLYQHQSALRLTLEGLGVTKLPGAAATAPAMWEFFTFPAPANVADRAHPAVVISRP
jgi:phosphatidylinositol-3-phosphatase